LIFGEFLNICTISLQVDPEVSLFCPSSDKLKEDQKKQQNLRTIMKIPYSSKKGKHPGRKNEYSCN
jgi:hypothetical protein